MKQINIIIVGLVVSLLSGCNDSSLEDLKKDIENQKANAQAFIPETPKLKQYEEYIYTSGGLKSPFKNTVSEVRIEKKVLTEVKPDLTRKKGELETYDLNSLKMIGTIKKSKENSLQAILSTGTGKVFIVEKGDYIGKNNGKILNISNDKINLEEIIPNGSYRWIKRPSTINRIKGDI